MSTGAPDLPLGRPAEDVEAGEPAGGSVTPQVPDQNRLYGILDSLVTLLGLDKEMLKAKYDGIIKRSFNCSIRVSHLFCNILDISQQNRILAVRPAAWTAWATSVKFWQYEETQPDVLSEVERIKSNIKYPQTLLGLETVVDIQEPNMSEFVTAVNGWTRDDHTIQWDQTHGVPRLWESLLFSWSHSKNAVENSHNEATQRPLVDSMMLLVFYQSAKTPDERYEVLLEMQLALPRPSKDYTLVSYSVKADTIVVKQPPAGIRTVIDEAVISDGFAFKWVLAFLLRPLPKLQLGAFPLESKRSALHNVDLQVAMDLSSIQHQRRILGLKDRHIYGATCAGGIFALYASKWRGERLTWMPVKSCVWDLKHPVQFIKCLYFLWALKKHLDESFKDDFDSFDVGKVRANFKQGPFWRFAPDSKKRRNDGKSESGSKRTRSGNLSGNAGDQDVEIWADNDSAVDNDDEISNVHRPMTSLDIIKYLPFICEQLLKFDRVGRWSKIVTSSEYENTLVHHDVDEITKGIESE
ncbi:hypothetical protein ACEPAI_1802 [Sanghuangporus weigelae]